MVVEVFMPQLGLTMDEADIVEWTKSEGDWVEADETLLVVETDKAATDVPSPASGIIGRIVVPEGDKIPVGTLLAYIAETEKDLGDIPEAEAPAVIGRDGGTPAKAPVAASSAQGPPEGTGTGAALPTAGDGGTAAPRSPDGERVLASPRARMRATQLGIDISMVSTSADRVIEEDVLRTAESSEVHAPPRAEEAGVRPTSLARRIASELGLDLDHIEATPGLRIRAADLLKAADTAERERIAAKLPRAEGRVPYETGALERLGRIRRITAERMTESSQTAPQVTYTSRADMTRAVELRAELGDEAERRGTKLTYDAMFVRAAAIALLEFPEVNAQWAGEEGIRLNAEAHVGVAVDLGGEGLIVPVVRNAQARGLLDTAAELSRLVDLAREGGLGPDDYKGGTFTVSNLGLFGVETFTPIVNMPEAAILGIGALVPTPSLEGGELVERPTITLSLTADHRIVDGAPAARFLARIRAIMERPLLLLGRGL